MFLSIWKNYPKLSDFWLWCSAATTHLIIYLRHMQTPFSNVYTEIFTWSNWNFKCHTVRTKYHRSSDTRLCRDHRYMFIFETRKVGFIEELFSKVARLPYHDQLNCKNTPRSRLQSMNKKKDWKRKENFKDNVTILH